MALALASVITQAATAPAVTLNLVKRGRPVAATATALTPITCHLSATQHLDAHDLHSHGQQASAPIHRTWTRRPPPLNPPAPKPATAAPATCSPAP